MRHEHHIVPKHSGGTDDLKNIVKLTVEEHAETHKKLFERHGKWEDYLAWQGLAGMMSKQELIKQMLSNAGKKGAAKTNAKKFVRRGNPKPVGTGGAKWYHNPKTTKRICVKEGQAIPKGFVPGIGTRKAPTFWG